jgi:hypothetical protein
MMPKPRKGENRQDFANRCIPYLIREGKHPNTKKGRKQAAGECYGIYDNWKKKQKKQKSTREELINAGYVPIVFHNIVGQQELFRYDEEMMIAAEINTEEIEGIKHDVVEIIAAMGDMFYQRVFVSKELLKKIATKWNGTIHDISHLATNYGLFGTENLEWVVGFHKKAKYDNSLGGVRMTAYISHDSPKYKAWRNYVDICKAADRTPNTSIYGYAKYGMLDASELPKGTKIPEGAKDSQGNVIYLKDLQPAAVTTCLRGKCDDKDGCGIESVNVNDCNSGSCNTSLKSEDEIKNKGENTPESKFFKMLKEVEKNG